MSSSSLINIIMNGNDMFPLTDAYKGVHRFYNDFIDMLDFF